MTIKSLDQHLGCAARKCWSKYTTYNETFYFELCVGCMLQGLNVGKSKTIDLKDDLQLMVSKSSYELMLEASPGVILILVQVND